MNRMYCNIDVDTVCQPYFDKVLQQADFDKQLLYPFVDAYKDTCVTDILFNTFTQYSATDSLVWTTYADKYLQKELDGKPVDYSKRYEGIYTINKKYNTDPYKIWIDRCKQLGINPWISLRMNDCHKDAELKSVFYYEAVKNNWVIGDKYGYFWECFDYKYEIVREMMLLYIEEQINIYNVYGIELDFMRDIYCFDYIDDNNDECVAIMNDFFRDVKKIISKAEQKWGHPIKIATRLTRDIDQSYTYGFDARTLAKEKLVDIIVPSSRWHHIDSEIPVDVWKKELPDIEILGCIETLLSDEMGVLGSMTDESARGLALSHLTKGADGIYLFNYFDPYGLGDTSSRDKKVFKTCASAQEILKHKIRCVVRGQERDVCPVGYKEWNPLGFTLLKNETEKVEITTGNIPDQKSVALVVGFEKGNCDSCEIKVNGKIIKDFKPYSIPDHKNLMPESIKTFCANVDTIASQKQIVEVTGIKDETKFKWMELIIE